MSRVPNASLRFSLRGLTYRQLMRRSEDSIGEALQSGSVDQRAVALRLYENHRYYDDWEARHSHLMHSTADARTPRGQIYFIRASVLSLAHVGSIAKLIRNQQLRGPERTTLLTALHRNRDSVSAMLFEHRNFIRAEASSICACDIVHALGDAEFPGLYYNYQQSLEQYLSLLKGAIFAEAAGEQYPLGGFLGEAKRILSVKRAAILGAAMRSRPPRPRAAPRRPALHA